MNFQSIQNVNEKKYIMPSIYRDTSKFPHSCKKKVKACFTFEYGNVEIFSLGFEDFYF